MAKASQKPPKPQTVRKNIRSQNRRELESWLRRNGHPRFRADQILRWLYARRVDSWRAMRNLPESLRETLAENFDASLPILTRRQTSADASQKYLWSLSDGHFVESVLLPANPNRDGAAADRKTLCVSTQVGCAYGCRFCASGLDGWKRHLTPDEIVGQVIAAENQALRETKTSAGRESPPIPKCATSGRCINNLVFMGMGEPLANYENLQTALNILNADWGVGIGARRITISTSGLAPQIRRLADEPAQYRLAVSLHGPTDKVRQKIMPINSRYPISELTEACEYYAQKRGKKITLEYILIEGVNDDPTLAKPLSKLALRLRAKVNLIPYNRVAELKWRRPFIEQQKRFFQALRHHGVPTTLRQEKGHDIDAACGQLRRKDHRAGKSSLTKTTIHQLESIPTIPILHS